MKIKGTKNILVLFHLLLLAVTMHAQETDSIAYDVALEDVLITAQYKPTDLKNVLYNVDIIHAKTIAARGATQLDQALLISPLIRLEQDMVLGPKIKFKGIDSRNVAILVDGVPVIGRLDGAVDLSQIPMQNIDKIEIVQGPLSNIYGNNAAGGAINLITKKAQLQPVNASLEGQYESIGFKNLQATLGLQSKAFRWAMHGRRFEYNQFPVDSLRLMKRVDASGGTSQLVSKYPWNPKTQISYGSSLLYRLNDDHKITLKYDHNHENVSDYDQVRRPAFKPYSNDNFYTTTRNDVALLYNGLLAKKNFIDFTLARNSYRRVAEDKRLYHETNTYDSLLYNADTISFLSYYSRLNFARPLNDKWEIMSGLTFTNDFASGDRIINRDNADSSTASFIEYAVYAEVKFKLKKNLQLMASGRQTVHSIYQDKFTPTFQLKYDLSSDLSLRASYAQGYRSPDLKELYIEFIDLNHFVLGNRNLKPETSIDKQLTLNYDKKTYHFNVGVYQTMINDRISLVEIEPPLKYQYLNFDRYDVYGLQGGFGIDVYGINFSSNLNLGYWSTGIDAESVPAYGSVMDINNNLSYRIPGVGIHFMLNHRYNGQQPNYSLVSNTIYINTLEEAHYIDVSANRSFLKNMLNLTAGIKNVGDVQTLNIAGTVGGIHQGASTRQVSQGRSYFVSLKFAL